MSQEHDANPPIEVDRTLPEVVQKFLVGGGKLESIRLHADGKWTHEGCDFENDRIVKLFSRSVNRTEGGTWVLEIGRFTYPIEVDDTGFFIDRIDLGQDPPSITLSDTSEESLDISTLSYDTGGRLYCTVKSGKFRARFKRHAYYKLAELMCEDDDSEGQIILEIGGQKLALANIDDED